LKKGLGRGTDKTPLSKGVNDALGRLAHISLTGATGSYITHWGD